MQYKTLTLGLIEDRPALCRQLTEKRHLLPAMENYAVQLKEWHVAYLTQLTNQDPETDQSQLSSEALELALRDLAETLDQSAAPA